MPPQHNSHHHSRGRSKWDALALAGFLVLAVIVVWGIVHAARLAAPYLKSLFPTSSVDKIEVTAPNSVVAGTPFTIRWQHAPKVTGGYIFLYQCREGLGFTSTLGGELVDIACGTAFPVTTDDRTLTLSAKYEDTSELAVPVSIIFVPKEGEDRNQGGATIKVMAASTPGSQTTNPPATPSPSTGSGTGSKPKPAGNSDLSVTILSIGVIDPYSGQFMAMTPMSPSDMVAVQFDIANVGGSSTGVWYFGAELPTVGGYTYFSPAQAPLGPGDHIVNTLRFTNSTPGGGIISIQVDPANLVHESNEGNNYASQHIYVPYYYQY